MLLLLLHDRFICCVCLVGWLAGWLSRLNSIMRKKSNNHFSYLTGTPQILISETERQICKFSPFIFVSSQSESRGEVRKRNKDIISFFIFKLQYFSLFFFFWLCPCSSFFFCQSRVNVNAFIRHAQRRFLLQIGCDILLRLLCMYE